MKKYSTLKNCPSARLWMFLILAFVSVNGFSGNSPFGSPGDFTGKHFYAGAGFGFEFIYPGEINDYITEYYESNSYTTSNAEIYLSLVPHVQLTYRFNRFFDLVGSLEYGWAPKFISKSGGSSSVSTHYSFNRGTLGLTGDFHIPIGGHNTMFLGGGLMYHSLKFSGLDQSFKSSDLAPRAQMGFSFNIKKFNPQVFILADFAKTEADGSEGFDKLMLNYSGGMIGVNFNF